MVFVLTYGFIGLEVVAIELDNPFGNDPNDFNCRYVVVALRR
jgi:predicted membrane chloride channel (bestrophin family)